MAHVIQLLPETMETEKLHHNGLRTQQQEQRKAIVSTYLNLLMDHTFLAPRLLSLASTATSGPFLNWIPFSGCCSWKVSIASFSSMSMSVPVATENGMGEYGESVRMVN